MDDEPDKQPFEYWVPEDEKNPGPLTRLIMEFLSNLPPTREQLMDRVVDIELYLDPGVIDQIGLFGFPTGLAVPDRREQEKSAIAQMLIGRDSFD